MFVFWVPIKLWGAPMSRKFCCNFFVFSSIFFLNFYQWLTWIEVIHTHKQVSLRIFFRGLVINRYRRVLLVGGVSPSQDQFLLTANTGLVEFAPTHVTFTPPLPPPPRSSVISVLTRGGPLKTVPHYSRHLPTHTSNQVRNWSPVIFIRRRCLTGWAWNWLVIFDDKLNLWWIRDNIMINHC